MILCKRSAGTERTTPELATRPWRGSGTGRTDGRENGRSGRLRHDGSLLP